MEEKGGKGEGGGHLDELELEALGLAASAEPTVVHAFSVKLNLGGWVREKRWYYESVRGRCEGGGGRTVPSVKPKRFCTREVSSRMRRPLGPRTSMVRVALMMISVLMGVLRTCRGSVT